MKLKGRPSKIKNQYLDFVKRYLKTGTNKYTTLYSLGHALRDKFKEELGKINKGTIKKMVKMIKNKRKRVQKVKKARNA